MQSTTYSELEKSMLIKIIKPFTTNKKHQPMSTILLILSSEDYANLINLSNTL